MNELLHHALENLLSQHLAIRRGERFRRLKEGHGHAEKLFLQQVWWPAFGNFNDLHPEYEVKDFRDGTRFLDFALLRHSLKLAIKIRRPFLSSQSLIDNFANISNSPTSFRFSEFLPLINPARLG